MSECVSQLAHICRAIKNLFLMCNCLVGTSLKIKFKKTTFNKLMCISNCRLLLAMHLFWAFFLVPFPAISHSCKPSLPRPPLTCSLSRICNNRAYANESFLTYTTSSLHNLSEAPTLTERYRRPSHSAA